MKRRARWTRFLLRLFDDRVRSISDVVPRIRGRAGRAQLGWHDRCHAGRHSRDFGYSSAAGFLVALTADLMCGRTSKSESFDYRRFLLNMRLLAVLDEPTCM